MTSKQRYYNREYERMIQQTKMLYDELKLTTIFGPKTPSVEKLLNYAGTSSGLKKPTKKSLKALRRIQGVEGILWAVEKTIPKTDKKLVIAGDTSDTDDYVKLLKDKSEGNPNIVFTGFVSGDLLSELYSNAYINVLPSDLEGMSLSLLEALAYRNVLLCSDIPENTAVAEDKAIYFQKGNTEDLAKKLNSLCANREVVEKFREGVDDFILNKYSWIEVAQATCELYQK